MIVRRINEIILFCLFIFLLQACNSPYVYESKVDFEETLWSEDSILNFEFDISTEGKYHIYYLIKNKTDYPFSNLYLKSDLRNGDVKISNELQEVTLFDPKTGKPYGRGFGGVMEHKFYSLKGIELKKGKHKLILQHHMREQILKGIIAIGIIVEKVEE